MVLFGWARSSFGLKPFAAAHPCFGDILRVRKRWKYFMRESEFMFPCPISRTSVCLRNLRVQERWICFNG